MNFWRGVKVISAVLIMPRGVVSELGLAAILKSPLVDAMLEKLAV